MKAGSAPSTAACSPFFFSSAEKYGEKKNTASSRFSCSASANWSSCSLTVSSWSCSEATSNSERAYTWAISSMRYAVLAGGGLAAG